MGCGATKLQTHVTQPNYHGSVKHSIETSSVNQRGPDDHSTVNEAVIDEPLSQSIVEVIYDHNQEKETITCDNLEGIESNTERQQVVEKQQQQEDTTNQEVNNQNEMSRVTSISQFHSMKPDTQDDDIKEQTADIADNHDYTDYTDYTVTSLQCNELLTNPQQCCSNARSLSRSPRIVSLQIELGFVSITSTDLDLLQSKRKLLLHFRYVIIFLMKQVPSLVELKQF